MQNNPKGLNMCQHINMCRANMGNMTLSVPEEVHKKMKQFPEVKWSEVARRAFMEKLETLSIAEELAKKSKLTETDIKEFSKKIKASAARRLLK